MDWIRQISASSLLKLLFITTFEGNRQPIYLTANTEEAGTWYFNTADIHFMEVRVRPQKQAARAFRFTFEVSTTSKSNWPVLSDRFSTLRVVNFSRRDCMPDSA